VAHVVFPVAFVHAIVGPGLLTLTMLLALSIFLTNIEGTFLLNDNIFLATSVSCSSIGIAVVEVVKALDLLHGHDSAASFLDSVNVKVKVNVGLGENRVELGLVGLVVICFDRRFLLLLDFLDFLTGLFSLVGGLDLDCGLFLLSRFHNGVNGLNVRAFF